MSVRTAHMTFKSQQGSELWFGKWITEKKESSETHAQFDERTWKEKIHHDDDGKVFIQPFALKNCLESAGKWMSMPIPGEGKKTFTKRFQAGTIVVSRLYIEDWSGRQTMLDDVLLKTLPVPSGGERGQGKRVVRVFPYVPQWQCNAEIMILDDKIDDEVLAKHLETCGMFIGFGSMRVENGGINGRFEVIDLSIAA